MFASEKYIGLTSSKHSFDAKLTSREVVKIFHCDIHL